VKRIGEQNQSQGYEDIERGLRMEWREYTRQKKHMFDSALKVRISNLRERSEV